MSVGREFEHRRYYTMVGISTVLGIVCYNALAGRIFASAKADRASILCMDGDYDIEQDVVCRR